MPSARLQPVYPVEFAALLKVPVLGLYGGAPHAFYADYRPSYRKEAAEDGFKRMLAWFRQYGVA